MSLKHTRACTRAARLRAHPPYLPPTSQSKSQDRLIGHPMRTSSNNSSCVIRSPTLSLPLSHALQFFGRLLPSLRARPMTKMGHAPLLHTINWGAMSSIARQLYSTRVIQIVCGCLPFVSRLRHDCPRDRRKRLNKRPVKANCTTQRYNMFTAT